MNYLTIHRLDTGVRFASKSNAPLGNMPWIEESVAAEFDCDPEHVGVEEGDDGTQFITVDGVRVAFTSLMSGEAYRASRKVAVAQAA